MLQLVRLAIIATSATAALGVTTIADAAPVKPNLSDVAAPGVSGQVDDNTFERAAAPIVAPGGAKPVYPAPPPQVELPTAFRATEVHDAPELDPAGAAAVGMIFVGAGIILVERRRRRA